jgi:DNA invertase Pin-like site-specific DNA recombinase
MVRKSNRTFVGDVIVVAEVSRLGRSILQVLEILEIAAKKGIKEALQKRKMDGMTLGKPRVKAETLKLDAHREEITGYLKKGIGKRDIIRLIECSLSTLYLWLDRRQIHTK